MKKAISIAFIGVLALALFSGCASAPLTYKGQPLATIDTSNWTQDYVANTYSMGEMAFIKSSDGCTMAANPLATGKMNNKFVPGIFYLDGIDKGVDTSNFPIGTWKLDNKSSTTFTFEGTPSGGTVTYKFWNTDHTSTRKMQWTLDGNMFKFDYGQDKVASLVPGMDFFTTSSWNNAGTCTVFEYYKGFDNLADATTFAQSLNSGMTEVGNYTSYQSGINPLSKYGATVLVYCDAEKNAITSVRLCDNANKGAGSKRWDKK